MVFHPDIFPNPSDQFSAGAVAGFRLPFSAAQAGLPGLACIRNGTDGHRPVLLQRPVYVCTTLATTSTAEDHHTAQLRPPGGRPTVPALARCHLIDREPRPALMSAEAISSFASAEAISSPANTSQAGPRLHNSLTVS